jgi:hypothetical protein
MEEQQQHLEEVEEVEQEASGKLQLTIEVDEVDQLVIFQAITLLNIIGKDKEVLVGHFGIISLSQHHRIMVVMEILVELVEVVEMPIVVILMVMIGMEQLIEVKVVEEKVTAHVDGEVMEVQVLFK